MSGLNSGSAPHSDKRLNAIRDDASHLERHQSGPRRPPTIRLDLDRGPPRLRGSINDNARRDSNYDKLKDENPKEGGSDRVVRPTLDVRIPYYTDNLLTPLYC